MCKFWDSCKISCSQRCGHACSNLPASGRTNGSQDSIAMHLTEISSYNMMGKPRASSNQERKLLPKKFDTRGQSQSAFPFLRKLLLNDGEKIHQNSSLPFKSLSTSRSWDALQAVVRQLLNQGHCLCPFLSPKADVVAVLQIC